MTVQAFRLQNFMCFEDSGWLELRPLTLLYGRHSSGKSAIFRALLLLRQSLASKPSEEPLIFARHDGFDFGSYAALVRDHDTSRLMSFWFKCEFEPGGEELPALAGSSLQVRLSYQLANSKVHLHSVALYDQQEELIWQAKQGGPYGEQAWSFSANFFGQESAKIWSHTAVVVEEGFFPRLQANFRSAATFGPAKVQELLCHL